MPVYDFSCTEHGLFEDLVKWDVYNLPCPLCSKDSVRQVSAPLKTSTLWGDTPFGINGHYDKGLGCRITSYADTDRKLAKRGLVRESDLGGDMYHERCVDAQLAEKKRLDKNQAKLAESLKKFDGNKELAMIDAFPARQMLEEADAYDKLHKKD